ncbi:MAG: HPP family protein [bacterium]
MVVKEIMIKNIVTVKRSTTLKEIVRRLKNFFTFPLVPVVEDDGRLIGTVSFNNLINVFQPYEVNGINFIPFLEREEVDIFELDITPEMAILIVVDDIMETKIYNINQDEPLEKAYNIMQTHSLDRLPVVNHEQKLVGMIGMFSILVALFRQSGIIKE